MARFGINDLGSLLAVGALLVQLAACSEPTATMAESEPPEEEVDTSPNSETDLEAERREQAEQAALERRRQQEAERASIEQEQRLMAEAATSTASMSSGAEQPVGSSGGGGYAGVAPIIAPQLPDSQLPTVAPVVVPVSPSVPVQTASTDPSRDEGVQISSDSDSSLLSEERDGFILPAFPWPPEQPSSRMRVERRWLVGDEEESSLATVEQRLTQALTRAGYFEHSFYSVPGGFALVTRLEGIDGVGRPLSSELRYVLPRDERPFSLTEFIGGLFFAPEGNYRFVTFIVSDQPFMTSTDVLPETVAITRLQGGATDLPASFADVPVNEDLKVEALIYEYRKSSQQASPELLRPGRLPPKTHMVNSGISTALDQLPSN